jgi:hypothetical protein
MGGSEGLGNSTYLIAFRFTPCIHTWTWMVSCPISHFMTLTHHSHHNRTTRVRFPLPLLRPAPVSVCPYTVSGNSKHHMFVYVQHPRRFNQPAIKQTTETNLYSNNRVAVRIRVGGVAYSECLHHPGTGGDEPRNYPEGQGWLRIGLGLD